jgi:hypothetical protein
MKLPVDEMMSCWSDLLMKCSANWWNSQLMKCEVDDTVIDEMGSWWNDELLKWPVDEM